MLHKLISIPEHLVKGEDQLLALPFIDFLRAVSVAYDQGLFDEQEIDISYCKSILEESVEHRHYERLFKAYVLLLLEQSLADDTELKRYLIEMHTGPQVTGRPRGVLMLGFFTMLLAHMREIKGAAEAPLILKTIAKARTLHAEVMRTMTQRFPGSGASVNTAQI